MEVPLSLYLESEEFQDQEYIYNIVIHLSRGYQPSKFSNFTE